MQIKVLPNLSFNPAQDPNIGISVPSLTTVLNFYVPDSMLLTSGMNGFPQSINLDIFFHPQKNLMKNYFT
jgi:hypothetical protein